MAESRTEERRETTAAPARPAQGDLKKALENPNLTSGQRDEIRAQLAGDTSENPASRSDPDEAAVDASTGMLLPNREIAGGAIREVLEPEPDPQTPRRDLAALAMRAAGSAVSQKAGGAIGRPVSDWGLLTKGDRISATMILVDLDTGQKVEIMGGNVTELKDDRLFANARNFPQALVEGDTLERLVSGKARD
jgi:hypothetical protein